MTVEQLVSQTKAYIAEAAAQMKKAEITGTPPSEIPGAEHDKPIPEGAKDPDPQVADGSMGPASAYNEGGEPQKNEPVGQLFEADEPVLNPEEKPEVTADANAKTASTSELANSLLADIKSAQEAVKAEKAKEAAAKAAEKKAEIVADKEPAEVTKKPEETADANADAKDTDNGGTKETVEADTTAGETPPEKDCDVNCDKQASDELQLTTDLLAKLACYMLAEEEGAALAEKVLTKVAGDQAAQETLDYLQKQAEAAEYQDAFIKGAQAAEDMIGAAAEQQGADDAAALMGMGGEAPVATEAPEAPAEGEGEDGVTPEEFMAALDSMVQSGEITPEQAQEAIDATGLGEGGEGGDDGEDIDVEQLASEIEEAISSGAISMDEAEALVQELSGDADPAVIEALQGDLGEGAAEAAAATEPAPAEGDGGAEPATPAEPAPAEPAAGPAPEEKKDETKEAAAKDLLEVIHRIKEASAKKAKAVKAAQVAKAAAAAVSKK